MNGRFVAGKRHDSAPPSVSADNQEFPSLISGHAFVPHFSALGKKVEKSCVLRGFLKSDEFGSRGGQPLRFQQQVVEVAVAASAA